MVSRFLPFEGLLTLAVTMDAARKLVSRLSSLICGSQANFLVECRSQHSASHPCIPVPAMNSAIAAQSGQFPTLADPVHPRLEYSSTHLLFLK